MKIDILDLDDDIVVNIPVRFLSGYDANKIYSRAIDDETTIDLASLVGNTNLRLRKIIDLEPVPYFLP